MATSFKHPYLEKLNPSFGSSISLQNYDPGSNQVAEWHYHPELEIVYVNGGSGKRHIGNHVSYYHDGDLLFIGPNLPHYGFTNKYTGNKLETVLHIKEDFLGAQFLDSPEMTDIKLLFERTKQGISFHGDIKEKVGGELEKLKDLSPFEKLIKFLDILNSLASSDEYTLLSADGIIIESKLEDTDRIQKVFDYVSRNYKEDISLSDISALINMTVPAFCRYFKKMTAKTFVKFVNEHKVVQASKLLAEQPISITEVCYESGFKNFSHFSKQFKQFTGKTPSEYRNQFKQIIKGE